MASLASMIGSIVGSPVIVGIVGIVGLGAGMYIAYKVYDKYQKNAAEQRRRQRANEDRVDAQHGMDMNRLHYDHGEVMDRLERRRNDLTVIVQGQRDRILQAKREISEMEGKPCT